MKPVASPLAPAAIGAYSQAIVHAGIVYCSGQIGLTPEGDWAGSDVRSQTRQCLANLNQVLNEAGSGITGVIRATIFLVDMGDFAVVNEEYAEFFAEHRPARACVEASALPKNALVEISCIAAVL
jgi:2-iminobutanoate/2-iminopropanoate deaminase